MWEEIASLHAHHGEVAPEVRVLKLAEETGEAAAALIGMHGWNSRKGVCATEDDLLAELSDVIITAGVAMAGITGDPSQAAQAFRHHLENVLTRAGLEPPARDADDERHWTASAVILHPSEDKVLLIDHVKSGLWLFPGGHVGPGETLAEAVIREIREETGINAELITGPLPAYDQVVTHPAPFAVIEARAADPVNGDHRHLDAIFVASASTGQLVRLDHREATSARWAGIDDMRELSIPPELPALTKDALVWAARHRDRTPAPRSAASLLMATSNAAKAATAAGHLAPYGITVEQVAMELDEIQSVSVEEVALHKARQAHTRLQRPVIAEDSGFLLDELGGFPGALAKPATSMLGVDGIIRLADTTRERRAHFVSAVAYVDSAREQTFTSTGPAGAIADRPAASTREGAWSALWDIWIPPGRDLPVSALPDAEFSAYLSAWRGRSAFTLLGEWLRQER